MPYAQCYGSLPSTIDESPARKSAEGAGKREESCAAHGDENNGDSIGPQATMLTSRRTDRDLWRVQ
jgi:hypothetical protein